MGGLVNLFFSRNSPTATIGISSSSSLSSPIMDVIGILRKAIKLLTRNEKVYLQVILLTLPPLSFLVLLHYLVAAPFLQKIEESYETSSLDRRDAWALVGVEFPFLIAFFLVFLFGTSVTIFASAKEYSANPATLKQLLLWILPSSWKKPIITWLYLSLIISAYMVLSLVSIQLTALIGTENATSVCLWLMGIFAATTYPYFASVWILGLVISVLEGDTYGVKAIKEAQKLMGGRKLHGFLLMFFLVLLSIPVSVLFYLTMADDDDEIAMITRFAFTFGAALLFCSVNLFTFVVFTVFYFECKQFSDEGKIWIEFGSGNHLLPVVICTEETAELLP